MLQFSKYQNLIGFLESGNDYNSINSIGAIGRYQFMPATLDLLKNKYGLQDWYNSNYFKSNPTLQDLYFKYLVADSIDFIYNNHLNNYFGYPVTGNMRFKNISGNLNLYGSLAGIHLAGSNNFKKFLENGYNYNDGKTSISDYAAYFSKNLKDQNIDFFTLTLAFIPAIILYYI